MCSICGASFAGLAVARELAGSGARVMVVDRYEIGERQTSACAIPTGWLEALELTGALQQTFGELVIHTPHGTSRYTLPWTFSTFDYRDAVRPARRHRASSSSRPRRSMAASERRRADRPRRDPRAADRRCARLAARARRRGADPAAGRVPLTRARGPSAAASATSWRSGSTAAYVPAGYGWSFPAGDEVRVGVGSFDPRFHVKEPTVRLARRPRARRRRLPGQLDPASAARGDRGRHLLRRRLGRALPAADRRGDPYRPLLRDRVRARVARRDRRAPVGGSRARRATARSAPPTAGSSSGCCAFSSSCRACLRACSAPGLRGDRSKRRRRLVLQPIPGDRPPEYVLAAGAARDRALTPA